MSERKTLFFLMASLICCSHFYYAMALQKTTLRVAAPAKVVTPLFCYGTSLAGATHTARGFILWKSTPL